MFGSWLVCNWVLRGTCADDAGRKSESAGRPEWATGGIRTIGNRCNLSDYAAGYWQLVVSRLLSKKKGGVAQQRRDERLFE